MFTARMPAAFRRNPHERTYNERVFGYEISRFHAVCEHLSTCWNPVYLHTSHAWRYRQTKPLPHLLEFHIRSWPSSRSPAWMAAWDDERKSQRNVLFRAGNPEVCMWPVSILTFPTGISAGSLTSRSIPPVIFTSKPFGF
jgi:hypothetical protein